MLNREPIRAADCRWQFLFPEGLREQYRLKSEGKVPPKVIWTTYNRKTLERMMADFDRMRAFRRQFGMPQIAVPVDLLHGTVHRNSPELRARIGDLLALRYHNGKDGIPAGLWGLVQWNNQGFDLIGSGKYKALSPTTESTLVTEDGQVHKGLFLTSLGLVDEGYFSTIGTVGDYVSTEHWPIPEEYVGRPIVRSRQTLYGNGVESRGLRVIADPQHTLMRQASHKGELMDGMVEEPETRMDNEGAGAAKVAVIDDDTFEELFSRMKPRMAEEVVRVCQERGYMTKEDAQSMVREIATMTVPAAKPGQEEPATRADADPEKEPEVMDRAKDEAVSALKREALKVANDEALRMVRERRLPSARIDRFVSLSLEGEDTAHLLVDGAAMSTPVGRSAGATASEPARKQETVVLTREAARIRHELYSENLDEAEFNKALTDRMRALTRDAAKRGAKVVDNDGDEETDD